MSGANVVQNEKKKLQLAEFQLIGVYFCCLGRIRTLTGGTRIRRATITPLDKSGAKLHFLDKELYLRRQMLTWHLQGDTELMQDLRYM